MTHRVPFQPLPCCDSVKTGLHPASPRPPPSPLSRGELIPLTLPAMLALPRVDHCLLAVVCNSRPSPGMPLCKEPYVGQPESLKRFTAEISRQRKSRQHAGREETQPRCRSHGRHLRPNVPCPNFPPVPAQACKPAFCSLTQL